MSSQVVIDHLRFEFGSSWCYLKYDESSEYKNGIGKLQSSKAVDVVALHADDLYLIELKNFRGHRIENKARLGKDLAIEVALKVRDSLAGVIGAALQTEESDQWQLFSKALSSSKKPPKVCLILDRDQNPSRKENVGLSTLTKELKKQLRWFTTKVLVVSKDTHNFPDLELHFAKRSSS